MNRRIFLKSTLAGTGAVSLAASMPAATEPMPDKREYYELRRYRLRRGPMSKLLDEYLKLALIPALRRVGTGPVGVFNVTLGPDSPAVYVLIPHPSLDSFGACPERLAADPAYAKDGAAFLEAHSSQPAFVRMESSLMRAFAGMPRLEVPAATEGGKPRLFELRTYESASMADASLKIRMFNEGEIAIFRRTGLAPVFFGETLVGGQLPNLTYMIWFEDAIARERCWDAFRGDPAWKKLSTDPFYTKSEIVSNITNALLRPAAYSQI